LNLSTETKYKKNAKRNVTRFGWIANLRRNQSSHIASVHTEYNLCFLHYIYTK